MAYCRNCGKEINENAHICIHCGALVQGNKVIKRRSGKKYLYQTPSFWLLFSAGIAYGIIIPVSNMIFSLIRLFSSDYHIIQQYLTFSNKLVLILTFIFFLLAIGAFVTSIFAEKKEYCTKTYIFICLFVLIFSFFKLLSMIFSILTNVIR